MTSRHLPSSIFYVLLMLALASVAPLAIYGDPLSGTDYGKSQNTAQDLANSLVPGKPNLSKGEKKSEIDTKTLQSKKVHDRTFEGGLNDIGLDWDGDKMGKPTGATTNSKTPKATDAAPQKETAKQTDVATDKNSNASKSTDPAVVVPNKTEKAEAAKPEQKSADKEKTEAKPDDQR